jgi:RNA polymerase sigma-70 factor, ECF subfamily
MKSRAGSDDGQNDEFKKRYHRLACAEFSPECAKVALQGRPERTPARHNRMTPPEQGITQLLQAWGNGDQQALELLTPLVYKELHRLAERYMADERPGHTLQTTALVNEAYLRLVDVRGVSWQNRAHFFALCARTMRRILIDFARSRQYQKRGGDVVAVAIDEALEVVEQPSVNLVALDDALNDLPKLDPRKAQVVELRFFGGLSVEEAAEALKISPETVMRDWKFARVWLARHLSV